MSITSVQKSEAVVPTMERTSLGQASDYNAGPIHAIALGPVQGQGWVDAGSSEASRLLMSQIGPVVQCEVQAVTNTVGEGVLDADIFISGEPDTNSWMLGA